MTPEYCACCGTETNDLKYSCEGGGMNSGWLCLICRSTHVGNTFIYPNSYDAQTTQLARMIAEVGNVLLKEIKKK